MNTIDPSRNRVAILQRELSALRERGAAGAPRSPAASTAQAAAPSVLQRVRALDLKDPERRRKAVRIYLESALAREFGPALLNDPDFARMLEAIERQMQQDAQLAAAVHAAGDLLLAGTTP